MGEPLILASHLPGEGHLHSERFRVVPWLCADELDYWRGLASVWDHPASIINAEHDIEWTDEHISSLLACPHPLCSWAYECHWASTGIGDVIAAGAGARDAHNHPPPDAYYLQGGEEWAQWSAIGLVKITPDARVGPLRPEPWNQLELAVEDAVKGPWHMHWPPLAHHHW